MKPKSTGKRNDELDVVHVLSKPHQALCGLGEPADWPDGHGWVYAYQSHEIEEKHRCPECYERLPMQTTRQLVVECMDTIQSARQRIHQAYHDDQTEGCRCGVCPDLTRQLRTLRAFCLHNGWEPK